ncbi:glycosyltransferase family 39 protein [Acetobacteraceae bacterium ESL0709]|nr:glycosyltransferase family 39 protein [Acetobacteraceae bacterium ESL0697]MDF7678353.1 glycosyltransferase family 39 protein [Acetobacteraceae bacterium ESL0709]
MFFSIVILFILIVLRFILAAFLPLSPDEAYYWLWSKSLQTSYFDHPFMVALWIRLGTILWGDSPFGIRFFGPLSAVLGTIILSMTARQLYGTANRQPVYAALLLNGTIMFGFGMIIMTPDTPLLFFTILTLWAFVKALRMHTAKAACFWWALTGLCAGLAFDSKYTACFLVVGMGLYILIRERRLLQQGAVWFGAAITLLTTSPVVLWNAHHHWAGLLKQGARMGDWHPERALTFIAELAGGQIGLATPLVALVCFCGFLKARREKPVLFWLILPGVAVLLFHACGGRVQANWPAVLYPAFMLAGALVSWGRNWAVGTAWFCMLVLAVQGLYAPLPLGAHWDPVARQTRGWAALTDHLIHEAKAEHCQALFVPDYALASILAYHDREKFPIISPDQRWSYLRGHNRIHGAKALIVSEKRSEIQQGEKIADRYFSQRIVRSYHLEETVSGEGYRVQ